MCYINVISIVLLITSCNKSRFSVIMSQNSSDSRHLCFIIIFSGIIARIPNEFINVL
jgi:hypothetical protein